MVINVLILVLVSSTRQRIFPNTYTSLNCLVDVWNDGLIMHLFNSLSLCFQAIFYSIIISMVFAYLTTISFTKSLGTFLSKLRYLPPTELPLCNYYGK
jgi:NitT/TauT family transport system permease protein